MELNSELLLEVFFSYCRRPIHKKYQNIFNAECPICKEGKSAGRTRRLFYFPHKEYFYCHNCVRSWKPIEWLKEVTNWTFVEILQKNKAKKNLKLTKIVPQNIEIVNNTEQQDKVLPKDSFDIKNSTISSKYIQKALEYCQERRLYTAVNTCENFYLSLTDKIHKNRLIIPFFDNTNKIVCYQTRALEKHQQPKYLTKFGEKSIFGLNKINPEIPYVFIFEGPIDSMFVKNGVAMASLQPTQYQSQQLTNLIGHEQIWVLDNDKNNLQTSKKILKYIEQGKKIFIWPKEFSEFKDFNEICCKLSVDEIPWKFVVKHSKKGKEALIRQKLAF